MKILSRYWTGPFQLGHVDSGSRLGSAELDMSHSQLSGFYRIGRVRVRPLVVDA